MLNPNPQCHHVGEQGLGEVTGHEDGAPMTGVSVLINETSQSSLVPSAMGGRSKRWVAMTKEVGLLQSPSLLVPRSRTSQPPECEK